MFTTTIFHITQEYMELVRKREPHLVKAAVLQRYLFRFPIFFFIVLGVEVGALFQAKTTIFNTHHGTWLLVYLFSVDAATVHTAHWKIDVVSTFIMPFSV